MKRAILLAAVTWAAFAAPFGLAAAGSQSNGPWCAVYSTGSGGVVWDCQYASVEACRPNVISGNRGFCNHNPGYEGPVKPRRRHAES
jgi:hypothetical protein